MKKTEIKPNVVYAYRSGKYGAYKAVMLLDVEKRYRIRHSQSAYSELRPVGDIFPTYEVSEHENGSTDLNGFATGTGYLAVVLDAQDVASALGESRYGEKSQDLIEQFIPQMRKVTLRQVLALRTKIVEVEEPSWSDRNKTEKRRRRRMEVLPKPLSVHLALPRAIVGEWDDIVGAERAAKELQDNLAAIAKAESEARVAAAAKRVEALRALNLPGQIEDAKETLAGYGSAHEWRGNTRSVRLTLAQIDALLSLIPEGATYVQPEIQPVEADGWTYAKPEYDEED